MGSPRPPTLLELVANHEPAFMVAALCRSAQPGGIDQLDEGGWGCLHHAASLGAVPHAEALLDAGADATLKSSASSGRYPKGMSPIGVAKQVQRTGLGDRTRVLHSLLLAAQAKGWGEWRELARADAARTDGRVPHTAPSTAAAVTSPEDAVRSKMRAELSIRDQRFKHAELEVQRLTERVQVAEKRMKASSLRADRLGARCQALEKQSQAQEMQLPVLQLALDEAFSRAVAAEHASATSLAALQRTQQEGAAQLKAAAAATEAALAAAAIVTEQRRQHSTDGAAGSWPRVGWVDILFATAAATATTASPRSGAYGPPGHGAFARVVGSIHDGGTAAAAARNLLTDCGAIGGYACAGRTPSRHSHQSCCPDVGLYTGKIF
jgi:hypothetical protein